MKKLTATLILALFATISHAQIKEIYSGYVVTINIDGVDYHADEAPNPAPIKFSLHQTDTKVILNMQGGKIFNETTEEYFTSKKTIGQSVVFTLIDGSVFEIDSSTGVMRMYEHGELAGTITFSKAKPV